MIEELGQLVWTLRLDDEHVVHVAELAAGLVVRPSQRRFFKLLREEFGDDRG
jgi:hypothetical protein